jgi:lipopolysaccharide export system protein LptA
MTFTAMMRGSLATLAILMAAGVATAQNTGVPNALQGFSQNKDQPVHIEAATLEVRDKDKRATFSGNVVVKQGDTTLRSKTLDVFYDQEDAKGGMKAAQPGPGGKQSIRRLEAKGGVVVTQKDQTATGQTGIFDMKSNTITMTGGVVITQGQNVLRGERLIVDVATGHARVEAGQGRPVSGMFSPGSKDQKDSKPDSKEAKPESTGGQNKPSPKGTTPRPQSGLSPLY